ncbi:MAG: hypothetical protein K9N23_17700 [Akkermansiaceae bacterium]|nr:hypothetical protein [Akkermansiaceae bacterium]
MKLTLLATVLAAALVSQVRGDGTGELLTTIGTTVTEGATTHAYLLWQPGDAASTLGRRFAIYAKPGQPDAAGDYTRLGIQTLQASPNTARALLELGAKLDRSAAAANVRIDGIYRDVTLAPGSTPATPTDPSLDAAGKLCYLIQCAVTDPQLLSRLFILGRAHPGVMQVLGHGFSIPVPAGVRTFEVREIDLADHDLRVVGRVTLDPAAPLVPAAPSAPFQVFHPVKPGSQYAINAKDNLNARFRWGVDATLRAQLPHTFGFDLFRVKKAVAEELGWHLAPPAPEEMVGALNALDPTNPNPDIAMANELPILVGDLLTPAAAANPADQERIDFADDGVWHTGGDGRPVRRPYGDGEEFYYYVAARTIIGVPGRLSAGTLVQMCDRLPPHPASIFSVTSTFVGPANPADWTIQGGKQFLQLKIRQLPEGGATEEAVGYYVYRWSSAQEYLNNPGNPVFNRIGGLVPHVAGAKFITFNDNGAGAPTLATHPDRTVWYTVRAVGRSECTGEVLSGHSSPMAGVLRDFKAPAGPTGSFLVCRTRPSVEWVSRVEKRPEEDGLSARFTGLTVEVLRDRDWIAAAEVEIAIQQKDQSWLTVHRQRVSYQRSNLVRVTVPYREPRTEVGLMRIRVRAVAANGLISAPADKIAYSSKYWPYVVHRFSATARKDCIDISVAEPPFHESWNLDGTVNVINGGISFGLGQGVREWRVYRRIGTDGELSLIAKAEGDSIPNPGAWVDDALPAASGADVCYYGQILDQNANPSPLVLLGCVKLVNANLATPMLSDARIVAEVGDQIRLKLEWFCDPVATERFEVLCAVEGGGIPALEGLSETLSDVPFVGISTEFPELAFYPFQTQRVGAELGAGPGFGLEVTVPAANRVYFAVRACGPGAYPRAVGSSSNVVSARWQPEVTGPQPIIPWPARPLPGPFESRRVIESYPAGEGPFWPVKLTVDYRVPTAILVGLTHDGIEVSVKDGMAVIGSDDPPEAQLFKVRETVEGGAQLVDLMPFMLYRYQLPNEKFPAARANLVQCTPLIDRISWKYVDGKGPPGYVVRDPFFLFFPISQSPFMIPFAGDWTEDTPPTLANPEATSNRPPYLEAATGLIFVKDPLPVIQGAKYRHLLVQFEERGEIKRIIPIQPVQH